MNKFLVVCAAFALMLGAITLSAQTPAADVTGTWNGTFSTPNGDMQLTFHFKQDGTKLTGTADTSMGGDPIELKNGKVDGRKIYWETSFNDMTIKHEGTVAGDQMTVKVTGSSDNGFPAADLTLKRAKP